MMINWIKDKDSIRVLDFLLLMPDGYFSKADINKKYKVPFKKMDQILQPFLDCGILISAERDNGNKVYRLNQDNKIFYHIQKAEIERSLLMARKLNSQK